MSLDLRLIGEVGAVFVVAACGPSGATTVGSEATGDPTTAAITGSSAPPTGGATAGGESSSTGSAAGTSSETSEVLTTEVTMGIGTSESSGGSSSTGPAPECFDDFQCDRCKGCVDGICEWLGNHTDTYCPPDCYDDEDCDEGEYCTFGGQCFLSPCADDTDCYAGYGCVGRDCVGLPTLPACPPVVVDMAVWNLGGTPTNLALTDLDGDMDLDLVVAEPALGRLELAFNDGSGQFAPAGMVALDGPSQTISLSVGDLDADGDNDIVAARSGPYDLVVLLGQAGVFTQTAALGLPGSVEGLAIGPVDGDMNGDFVGIDLLTDAIAAWRTDGLGGLELLPGLPLIETQRGAAVADIDQDDLLDVVGRPEQGDDVLRVATADGGGGFILETPLAGTEDILWVHTADLDDSGEPDVVATRGFGLLIWLGGPGLTWSGPKAVATSSSVFGGRIADINGDLAPDLVSISEIDMLLALQGDGVGGFGCEAMIPVPEPVLTVDLLAAGDVNGDGKADIAVAAGDSVVILKL